LWKGAPFLGKEEVHWPNLPNCPVGGNAVPEEAAKELMKERAPKISRVLTVQCSALRTFQKSSDQKDLAVSVNLSE